jgi:malonyl CoA-acyl carrier protein transacylase
MKHLAAVSALIIATDNAVISTKSRVSNVIRAAENYVECGTPLSLSTLRAALEDLTFLKENVDDVHEYAIVLAHDLFTEASEDYR